MERNLTRVRRYSRREMLEAITRYGVGSAAALSLGSAGSLLAGCGGGKDEPSLTVSRSGRFVSADSLAPVGDIAVNIGRTFVKLNNGIPEEIGWEFPEKTMKQLPQAKFDVPDIYFLPLPPEANATPFKFIAFSNWSNGHKPLGTGDAPHVHPVVCIAPPAASSDGFPDEKKHVSDPDEIPEGYILGNLIPGAGDTIAPGIGEAYEYPEAPQLQPKWNTVAQNYFFYRGHLNGIGMGASYDFLNAKKTGILPATQPKLYPKPGYYPTKNVTTWDEGKKCHIFKLTDFVRAERWI